MKEESHSTQVKPIGKPPEAPPKNTGDGQLLIPIACAMIMAEGQEFGHIASRPALLERFVRQVKTVTAKLLEENS